MMARAKQNHAYQYAIDESNDSSKNAAPPKLTKISVQRYVKMSYSGFKAVPFSAYGTRRRQRHYQYQTNITSNPSNSSHKEWAEATTSLTGDLRLETSQEEEEIIP